jgi:hypothetical protein
VKKLLLPALFTAFLYPISVEGVSINYAFVLAPLLCLLVGRPFRRPPTLLLILVTWYGIVFVLAAVFQYELHGEALRRVASFLVFMSIFSVIFMRLEPEHVEAFKAALVMVSLLMSVASVFLFLSLGGSALGFEAKDLVGTQRYGFIYIMALWVL